VYIVPAESPSDPMSMGCATVIVQVLKGALLH